MKPMISNDRTYRTFEMRLADGGMTVVGYAAVFDTPTVLYRDGDVDYWEVIDPHAFDHTAMVDVVLNYNHTGKPVARTKNGTLQLRVDGTGLYIQADLSGTEEGRRLYEEIKGGYIDQMSFAFTVSEDSYDRNTHTRRILGIDRLFDVAAVDCPAYDATSISARAYFSAEAEKARQAEASHRKRKQLEILTNV